MVIRETVRGMSTKEVKGLQVQDVFKSGRTGADLDRQQAALQALMEDKGKIDVLSKGSLRDRRRMHNFATTNVATLNTNIGAAETDPSAVISRRGNEMRESFRRIVGAAPGTYGSAGGPKPVNAAKNYNVVSNPFT